MRKLILILAVIVTSFLMLNQIALANTSYPLPSCPREPLLNGNPITGATLLGLTQEYSATSDNLSQYTFAWRCKYKIPTNANVCPTVKGKSAKKALYDPETNTWTKCTYKTNQKSKGHHYVSKRYNLTNAKTLSTSALVMDDDDDKDDDGPDADDVPDDGDYSYDHHRARLIK